MSPKPSTPGGHGNPDAVPLIDAEQRLRLYRTMVRIRAYEEAIALCVEAGEVRTPCHLYIGQEAVAAGICAALRPGDYVFSNYRGHGHYLAHGGDGRAMLSEVFCRADGCCRGRGGSMHLSAPELGFMGNTAIVAGHLSLAAGAALRCQIAGEDRVAVAFFGDAATEEGVFAEVLNFAALRRLPLLLVCENNGYAAHMHLPDRQPLERMAVRAEPYMPSCSIDGNDAESILACASSAVARARSGEGPSMIECITHRWRGHVGPKLDLDTGIRTREELERWMARCPIALQGRRLVAAGQANEARLSAIAAEADAEVAAALDHARAAPRPEPGTLLDHIYAGNSSTEGRP